MKPLSMMLDDEHRELWEQLRGFMRDTVPDVEERIYKDGISIGYHTKEAGAFCGVFPRKEAIYLIFTQAGLLPDPDGLIGSDPAGYVMLKPDEPFPEEALFKLVVAALLIGKERH